MPVQTLNQKHFLDESITRPKEELACASVVLPETLICHPHLSNHDELKNSLRASSLIQRAVSQSSNFNCSNVGWFRDTLPLVSKNYATDEYVLVGTGMPTCSVVRHDTLDNEEVYCRLDARHIQNVVTFQNAIATEAWLPIERLEFYVEFGNMVFLDPQTVIMTTQVLDENPRFSEEQIKESLKKFDIQSVIFVKPIEVCGHSDMIVKRIDESVYIPTITDLTIIYGEDQHLVDLFQNELNVLARRIESMGFAVERLPIPIALPSGGRVLMMSPVNMSCNESDTETILFAPTLGEKAFAEIVEETELLPDDINALIAGYKRSMKRVLEQNHGSDIHIRWVECDFDKQGGPQCMTASWPEDLFDSPKDGLP